MKAVQIEVDEEVLNSIAKDKDFRKMDVSEFFHKAAKFFLRWKAEYEIEKQFKRAYSDPRAREEFDREMKEWVDEQVWVD
jgi:hypothetical protein